METYIGEYSSEWLSNGNPDVIKIKVFFERIYVTDQYTFIVDIQTDYAVMKKEFPFVSWKNVDKLRDETLKFLNDLKNDMNSYYYVPSGVFIKEFNRDCSIEGTSKEWYFNSIASESKQKSEHGWFSLNRNNIDLRFPENCLTQFQQNQIIEICHSKVISLFEDFDDRYGMMYLELQPSSFAESLRFAFKQISNPEEFAVVRKSKECRNAAMRCILPVLDTISRTCDNVEEDKVFDLIDGKIERVCFHGKESCSAAPASVERFNDYNKDDVVMYPIQLQIPQNAKKCALTDGKDGEYDSYSAYILCSFDTGGTAKYIYYENSLTKDVDNYLQCPVPKDDRRKAKGDIINVLKNAGFYADFEAIEKFKAKGIKTLIMNR